MSRLNHFHVTHLIIAIEKEVDTKQNTGCQESGELFSRCFFQPGTGKGKCQHDDIADLRNHIAVHQHRAVFLFFIA